VIACWQYWPHLRDIHSTTVVKGHCSEFALCSLIKKLSLVRLPAFQNRFKRKVAMQSALETNPFYGFIKSKHFGKLLECDVLLIPNEVSFIAGQRFGLADVGE